MVHRHDGGMWLHRKALRLDAERDVRAACWRLSSAHPATCAGGLLRGCCLTGAALSRPQDLSRLGRDLLVDDTPLAFLRQPDNGIPIFNFRCVGVPLYAGPSL